jgi:hypothetical protein
MLGGDEMLVPTYDHELMKGVDVSEIGSGERLYRVHTGDPSDELYIVRPAPGRYNTITDAEFEEGVRFRLRAKFGKAGWYMLEGLEDVTDKFFGNGGTK